MLILLSAAWILPGLVGHEPWKPDEAYSFGLVYHILQTGDWVVPTLAGEPFMEKPPLFYVTAALFAGLCSPWLPLHDGARLASGFYLALTLLFTALAARELYGRGRVATLALLACLGLAPLAHLLITDTALLAGLALGLYGFTLFARRHVFGGLCLGTGAGIAFLSKGLLGPGLLGLTALLLPLLHRHWRTRAYLLLLLTAAGAALPWLLGWPLALYLRSPELFGVWFWDNNVGRFLGSSGLGPKQEALFYLRTLPWFAWPAWLLALAALWRAGRRGWREPAILLPVTLLGVTLIALTGASDARQAYALPLLPPLALLAVPGARALPPLVERGLHGLGVALFALLGALLWLGWLALEHGMPARLTDYLMELTPPSAPAASTLALSVAVLFSAGWVVATLALRRHPQRALLSWSLGAALVLGLSMTLWIGRLDAAKSYRGVMASLDEALPPSHGCIASEGLGEPQRALLEYYAGVRTLRRRVHPRADCDLLLRQEQAGEAPAPGRKAWRVIWEGARSGDRNEQFRLYQRAPEGFPP